MVVAEFLQDVFISLRLTLISFSYLNMTIYAFYIFDRHCSCIYSREFSLRGDSGSLNTNNESDVAKLLFGMVYSLKNMAQKLAPDTVPNLLRSFSTGYYRVHFLESLTNFKFALVSDLSVDCLQDQLWHLYSDIFVNTVAFNALSPVEFGESKIQNAHFVSQSDSYLRSLTVFS